MRARPARSEKGESSVNFFVCANGIFFFLCEQRWTLSVTIQATISYLGSLDPSRNGL
jgi:hypothetical protein